MGLLFKIKLNGLDTPECCDTISIPRIGSKAHASRALTNHGSIYFPCEYSGEWVLLFCLTADCKTTLSSEMEDLNAMAKEFEELRSCDCFFCAGT